VYQTDTHFADMTNLSQCDFMSSSSGCSAMYNPSNSSRLAISFSRLNIANGTYTAFHMSETWQLYLSLCIQAKYLPIHPTLFLKNCTKQRQIQKKSSAQKNLTNLLLFYNFKNNRMHQTHASLS